MTRDEIKKGAIELAEQHGLVNLSLKNLCDYLGVAPGSFKHFAGVNFTQLVTELYDEGITGPEIDIDKNRMHPEIRRDMLLAAALKVAELDSFQNLTREAIALHAGVSTGLVTKRLGTMQQLKRSVMRAAIKHESVPVVAEGFFLKDKHALRAPPELKKKILKYLANLGG